MSLKVRANQMVEFTADLVGHARVLLERHALRAYDAIKLASASVAGEALVAAGLAEPIFLAADDRLLDAARAEGMIVDNPNFHP